MQLNDAMNDRQQQVVAAAVAFIILVVVFLCPWRAESSGEIRWSPIYQPPMSYVRSYDNAYGSQGGSRIKSDEAHIAFGLLTIEVLAVGVAGGVLYVFFAESDKVDEQQPSL